MFDILFFPKGETVLIMDQVMGKRASDLKRQDFVNSDILSDLCMFKSRERKVILNPKFQI